jgi:hypothetical protein
MAGEFPGVEIAVIIVTASIVLAGILIGIGKALSYKRIESFGVEELLQSIVNAAIIGSFAAITDLVGVVSSTIVSPTCSEGTVVEQLLCNLEFLNAGLYDMFQELVQILNILGYYQTIALDFGAFAISPFANLSGVSTVLSTQLLSMNLIMILVGLNIQVAEFIGANALGLLFPVGLVLRTVFATRKVGGFLIALSIGLFLFYPTFVLIFPDPQADIDYSAGIMANFSNNTFYQTIPVVELNDNYAIAGKLDLMSGKCFDANLSNSTLCNQTLIDQGFRVNISNVTNITVWDTVIPPNMSTDFSGDLTMISQSNSIAMSKALLYSVVAPIFSLIITIVFVKELASLLGSEIGLSTIASI